MNTATTALEQRLQQFGPLRFDDFMAFALYDPQWGYYTRPNPVFGPKGDFVTAPEMTALFGETLGQALLEPLQRCAPHLYEFGAGTGKLACDVMRTLGEHLESYNIIDLSGSLKARQQAHINETLPAHLAAKVKWLDSLPDTLNGIVIGNEVLDAMPIRVFEKTEDGFAEWWVHGTDTQTDSPAINQTDAAQCPSNLTRLSIQLHSISTQQHQTLSQFETEHGPWPVGYRIELGEQACGFVRTVCDRLQGLALMIDYGDSAERLLHPSKFKGSLRACKNHTAHDGFLESIGEQDLTAHVNFSAICDTLENTGCDLEGYCTQAHFLIGHGLLERAANTPHLTDPVQGAALRQAIQMLASEAEMGETFKVMAWSKQVDLEGTPLNHVFLTQDRSGEL